jgi:exodeoxyribonuclease V gamma subunit
VERASVPAGSLMIKVWYSNQLEQLAERLIANLKLRNGDSTSNFSLFALPPIVVPNRNIETYLRYEIARGAGIAAGLNFHVPERFQDELLSLCKSRQPELKRLHSAALRSFFIDILGDRTGSETVSALPDAVRSYLDAPGDHRDARDLHRFQLAGRLAQLFHQYNEVRPELLHDWKLRKARFAGTEFAATEEWQRALWDRLSELLTKARRDGTVDWVFPLDILETIQKPDVELPRALHIFGFSYLSHGFREMIAQIARNSTIDLYTFAPVDWRSVDAANRESVKAPPQRMDKVARSLDRTGDDDESIVIRWGRPGREHFDQLGQLGGIDPNPEFVDGDTSTTLRRLQGEILRAVRQSDEPFVGDDSLVILACPGIRREAEIVCNEIWRLIRDDDDRQGRSPGRLRFPDMAVLIADTANLAAYQAHFRAVLEELYDIPFNMVDLPFSGESRLLEAVLLLLDLPLGQFTRPEVLKVLTHPAVHGRFTDVDAARWRNWCVALEIVHGADRDDHRGTYVDREVFHWDQGLRRLVLGAFMAGPHTGEDREFVFEGAEYSPFDAPDGTLLDVARLVLLVRSLAGDMRFARTEQLTLTDWSDFFARMVQAYVRPPAENEQRALAICLHEIRRLRQLDVTGCKVGYRIAWAALREALEGQTASRGYYLADGVVVSPLREMRALPFRVIFLCGLGEGRFPVRSDFDPLDLTTVERRSGDVSPRDRDKYLFLETLTCARQKLYLSYIARDAQTGDRLDPSPLVSELVSELRRGDERRTVEPLVLPQPLRRFDAAYFPDRRTRETPTVAMSNYTAAAKGEWRARKLRSELRTSTGGAPRLQSGDLRQLDPELSEWLGLCPLDVAAAVAPRQLHPAVSLSDIRRFLECPLQGWARVMLRLPEEEADDGQRQDERFASGPLIETGLLRSVFLASIQRGKASSGQELIESVYDAHCRRLANSGQMPVGLFGEVERRRHLACLAGWHRFARERGLLAAGPWGVWRFGRAEESERVERVEPAIHLDVMGQRVQLYGRTEVVSTTLPGSLIPVVRAEAKEKDHLRGFLDAVVMALLREEHDPGGYGLHVIPGPEAGKADGCVRTITGIDAARARQFLTDVVTDLLAGEHEYLLPCEAAFAFLDPENKKPIGATVELMKEDDHVPCSSRYGPVSGFDRYEPLDDDEAAAIVERRFGLFRASGGTAR